ncbi:DUF6318 family protein [Brachybacterium alimentarium]|uniref:DUF6318 family protein n=1 Tax=Brachybacterium alimentarium TaxID=47845 RepID=UPI003FD651EB
MSRRLLAAVAAAALTCGISACTEGQESARTDPPADVVADAPSDGGGESPVSDGGGDAEGADAADGSTSAAADLPAPDPADFPGMDENTPEGAEQALRYFAAHMIWAYQSGDTSIYEGLYGPDCNVCEENLVSIQDLARDGRLWSHAEVSDVDLSTDEGNEDYEVAVAYRAKVGEHLEPARSEGEEEVPEAYCVFGGGMNWQEGRWIVDGVYLSTEEV